MSCSRREEIGPGAQVKGFDLARCLGNSAMEKPGECRLVKMLPGR